MLICPDSFSSFLYPNIVGLAPNNARCPICIYTNKTRREKKIRNIPFLRTRYYPLIRIILGSPPKILLNSGRIGLFFQKETERRCIYIYFCSTPSLNRCLLIIERGEGRKILQDHPGSTHTRKKILLCSAGTPLN